MNSRQAMAAIRLWYRAREQRMAEYERMARRQDLDDAFDALTRLDWQHLTDNQRTFVTEITGKEFKF